ncbi:hypothetical protein [Pseudomonas sp. LS-2]|nr:hypothetical protein [Pseudomonas sp. LS-2]
MQFLKKLATDVATGFILAVLVQGLLTPPQPLTVTVSIVIVQLSR